MIKNQIAKLPPSVPNPLFHRLMMDDGVSYLKEDDGIIGFDIDLDKSSELAGYLSISIRKQTTLAYCTKDRLILFPTLEKLFEDRCRIGELYAKEILVTDDTFNGTVRETGYVRDLIVHLTPPYRDVTIPDYLLQSPETVKVVNKALDETYPDDIFDDLPMDSDLPDMFGSEAPVEDLPMLDLEDDTEDLSFLDEVIGDPVAVDADNQTLLSSKPFESINELGNFVKIAFSASDIVVNQVLNTVLQTGRPESDWVEIARKLFMMLIEGGDI